jgi:predicted metal-binding membrane protein
MNTLPLGLAAPAGMAMAVGGTAASSLLLLAVGESGGWLPHGVKPAAWSIAAWAALFLAGWTLMTGAMMLPSSLPFLHAVQRVGGRGASAVAGIAYTAVWIAVGALQWAALWAAGDLLASLGPQGAERLAGASLIAAALFHGSPLARACQRVCARPFAILAQHWGRTRRHLHAAARAGVHYGVSCVGCCVPMVVIMFVVGVHHLVWVLVLALAMLVMKHAVWGARVTGPLVAGLITAGVAIGAGWWTVPLHSLRELCR